jgi:hypothetical protein
MPYLDDFVTLVHNVINLPCLSKDKRRDSNNANMFYVLTCSNALHGGRQHSIKRRAIFRIRLPQCNWISIAVPGLSSRLFQCVV